MLMKNDNVAKHQDHEAKLVNSTTQSENFVSFILAQIARHTMIHSTAWSAYFVPSFDQRSN